MCEAPRPSMDGGQLLLVHTPLHPVALCTGAVRRQKARHLPHVGGELAHVDWDHEVKKGFDGVRAGEGAKIETGVSLSGYVANQWERQLLGTKRTFRARYQAATAARPSERTCSPQRSRACFRSLRNSCLWYTAATPEMVPL
jgi:hypothetical protein